MKNCVSDDLLYIGGKENLNQIVKFKNGSSRGPIRHPRELWVVVQQTLHQYRGRSPKLCCWVDIARRKLPIQDPRTLSKHEIEDCLPDSFLTLQMLVSGADGLVSD